MEESIKQAVEIVKAQAGFRPMTAEEVCAMVGVVAASIRDVMATMAAPVAAVQGGTASRIGEKSVTCNECGKSFKLLTRKHLLSHGLSADEYRDKWGYKKGEPLVCKALQRERSKKMKDMKLWEKRRKKGE